MLMCAVVLNIKIWLMVAEYHRVCVLASLRLDCVCFVCAFSGCFEGFSTVAEAKQLI